MLRHCGRVLLSDAVQGGLAGCGRGLTTVSESLPSAQGEGPALAQRSDAARPACAWGHHAFHSCPSRPLWTRWQHGGRLVHSTQATRQAARKDGRQRPETAQSGDPKEAPSDGSTPRGRTGDAGGPADGRSEPGGTGGDGGDRPMEQLRAEWARDAFPMFFNRWVCDAWFGALRHACSESGPNPRLHDKFEEIEEKASERMVEVTERHFDSVRSPRDVTHLLFCALHLGTYHALTTTGVPQREALDVLDGLSGGAGERATTFASQFSTWMASWLSDSYTHVSRQLARMATDYGEGMGCEIESSDAAPGRGESTTLRVGSCFYRRVFSEWDAELLLQFVCCRRDSSYYQGLERFGVGFERTSGGVGAGSCCMRVFRKAGAPPDRGEGE